MHRVALVLPLLAGCLGPSPNATLADLPHLGVSMQIWASSDDRATKGFMAVTYDEEAFRASHGECAVIHDYDVDFPNVSLGSKKRGGGGKDPEFDYCFSPRVSFTIPHFGDAPLTSYRLTDGATTIEATFAPDTLVPHKPTLVSPSKWEFGGGDAVVMTWSHPNDLVEGATFLEHPIYFRNTENSKSFDIDAQFVGNEIRFSIPNPPPIVGSGYIVSRFGYTTGDAATCVGAESCWFSLEAGYAHSVKITD